MTKSDKYFYGAIVLAGFMWGSLDAQSPGSAPFEQVKARDIVRRHIQAIGGEEALRSVKDIYVAMTMEMPGSAAKVKIESWRSPPRVYTRSVTPGIGVTELGYDGNVAWTQSGIVGPAILANVPDEMIDRDPLKELETRKLSYLGLRTFGGHQYHAVLVWVPEGKNFIAYFDQYSALMVGMNVENSPAPSGQMSMSFEGYRRFGRVLYWTRMTTRTADGKELVSHLDSISHSPIDGRVFDLPATVRALQAKRQ